VLPNRATILRVRYREPRAGFVRNPAPSRIAVNLERANMRFALAFVPLTLAFASCHYDTTHPRTKLPHIDEPGVATPPLPGGAILNDCIDSGGVTFGERIQDLCLGIAARGEHASKIGCLPLVTHDPRKPEGFVSELGVRAADDVAERLKAAGVGGDILATPEMTVKLSLAGLDKRQLVTLDQLVAQRVALDMDVVVFGTIRNEHSVGAAGRDLLTFDLLALDLRTAKLVSRQRFALESAAAANEAAFQMAQRDSLWFEATGGRS
jgi:hypothetical protein